MKKIRMIIVVAAASLFFTGCSDSLEEVKPAIEIDESKLTGDGEDETDPPPIPPTTS